MKTMAITIILKFGLYSVEGSPFGFLVVEMNSANHVNNKEGSKRNEAHDDDKKRCTLRRAAGWIS